MSKPLTPNEALAEKKNYIHPKMIEAVNFLIVKNFTGGSFNIKQKEVVNKFLELTASEGITKDEVFNSKWLDFEKVFEEVGWKVSYDKPAYCETYEPSFNFKPKRT